MNKVFVIAEAGVNHNGSLALAKQLIDIAAESGADAVKFQSFKADKLVSKQAAKADYQLQSTEKVESQLDSSDLTRIEPLSGPYLTLSNPLSNPLSIPI